MRRGLFITLEGIDGCGKGTQAKLLAEALWERGYDVLTTRDPGGTEVGEAIRRLILSSSKEERASDPVLRMLAKIVGTRETRYSDGRTNYHSLLGIDLTASVRTESLVFLTARAQLAAEVIRPALGAGKIVICERYSDSTLAYQGYGKSEDLDWLRRVNLATVGGAIPDITYLLDITVEESLRRARERGNQDWFELMGPEFFEKVRNGYLELAWLEPERWKIIDGSSPPREITEEIISHIEPRLNEAGIEPRETLWRWERERMI